MSLQHAICMDILSFFGELVTEKALASVADHGVSGLPSYKGIDLRVLEDGVTDFQGFNSIHRL